MIRILRHGIEHAEADGAVAWETLRSEQSGAAALLPQSGNNLDIATANCSRSNCALGFVNQHRVHSLLKGLCRAANTCKTGLIVGSIIRCCREGARTSTVTM